jgi:hypothetical protein
MQAAYLYLNALLYLLFAVWCSFAPQQTAASLGYESLTSGGRSEYLVVYGGLQVGLAVTFWLLARNSDWHRAGVVVALSLYAPIVLYRSVTVARHWPVGGLTLATAGLEAVLLLGALWLVRRPA